MTQENGFLARIKEIRLESTGVKSFVIEAADGADLPSWSPGAHVDLALAPGMNRQYSLCGNPADRRTARFAVLKELQSRGGSIMLHDRVELGDDLDVIAVRNHFPLVTAERFRLVAGGIGITPLLAMARELDQRGLDWQLLYGGRTRAHMAFQDELEAFGDKVLIRPQDECGLLPLGKFLGTEEPGKVVYCCGPEPLIKAVEAYCAGWDESALQIERFHPKEQAPHAPDSAFDVELRRSDKMVTVHAGQSIADALEEVGVVIPRSCNEGTCGTCITKILEGIADHRDSFLRPKQRDKNNVIMVCCSRSRTPRLVLDV
ncbi:oxidoreductase [Sphingobium phenoxybenzoativorans]|uniref:Oxidoreductase n=1 Tax=Sphingobium phenoxybenzoativorans TaxID=1592790 RepID=A0A975Q2V6_9SPHN|nr:PDR/VanB family oxidoreductase [Sphingobium phenoxybenzoativorans]QUT06867.1 oxidoreductase [Sphingobium phenoxybenzoativorans]